MEADSALAPTSAPTTERRASGTSTLSAISASLCRRSRQRVRQADYVAGPCAHDGAVLALARQTRHPHLLEPVLPRLHRRQGVLDSQARPTQSAASASARLTHRYASERGAERRQRGGKSGASAEGDERVAPTLKDVSRVADRPGPCRLSSTTRHWRGVQRPSVCVGSSESSAGGGHSVGPHLAFAASRPSAGKRRRNAAAAVAYDRVCSDSVSRVGLLADGIAATIFDSSGSSRSDIEATPCSRRCSTSTRGTSLRLRRSRGERQ